MMRSLNSGASRAASPLLLQPPPPSTSNPDPIRPEWVIEGKPEARSKSLARSQDGASSVMAWSCTAGYFNWHYTVDETVHIISGEVFVTNEKERGLPARARRHGVVSCGQQEPVARSSRGQKTRGLPPPHAMAAGRRLARVEQNDLYQSSESMTLGCWRGLRCDSFPPGRTDSGGGDERGDCPSG